MSKVKLKSRHLWIAADLAAEAFGEVSHVYGVYYPQQHALILAPVDDPIFPTLHKAEQLFLKNRSLAGDKSTSLEEILIDHDLDDTDRDLTFMHQAGLRMLHIIL